MTEKRFEVVLNEFDEVEYIMDKIAMEDRDFAEFIDFVEDVCNENEQLKKDNKEYIRGLDLSKATSQSWASDVRELREQNCQLEKENEQLKKEIIAIEKRADKVYDENEQLKRALNVDIGVKAFFLEEELELNDTARRFIKEHNNERYKLDR